MTKLCVLGKKISFDDFAKLLKSEKIKLKSDYDISTDAPYIPVKTIIKKHKQYQPKYPIIKIIQMLINDEIIYNNRIYKIYYIPRNNPLFNIKNIYDNLFIGQVIGVYENLILKTRLKVNNIEQNFNFIDGELIAIIM